MTTTITPESDFDVVVIGAGISGIAAARFYLYVHPECRLAILEKDTCLGGVWSSRRSYEYFWTQWTLGMAEFSDVPMPAPPAEDTYLDTFNAKYTTKYLEDYADKQVFAGKSLRDRIRFDFEVQNIQKADGQWIVTGKETKKDAETIHSSKLIVASGLHSVPNLPKIPNKEQLEAPIIHQIDFGQSVILSSPDIKHITILGGCKSSADMAYACIKAGKSVAWIVRVPGTGPGFFLPAKGVGPYRNASAIGSTRFVSTLSPSFFLDNWWTRLLHTTSWGIKLITGFWGGVSEEIDKAADFGRPGTNGFEKMKPQAPIFWQNGSGGLLNRPDFWETLAPNVHFHLDEIASVKKHLICLKSGEELPTDALLLGTGFVPSLNFFDQRLLEQLDLPYTPGAEPTPSAKKWEDLEKVADKQVIEKYPMLGNPPPGIFRKKNPSMPYRLYNGIVPISDASNRSIAFVGHLLLANYFRAGEIQAIWTTAYLDGHLQLPSTEEMEKEVALFTAWCRRRYLSNGEKGNHAVFEMAFYDDRLLEQVGLKSHRRGFVLDYFGEGTMVDLRGLGKEYLEKYGRAVVKTGDLHSTDDQESTPLLSK